MADKTSTFTTRIFLNDQQAKSKLEDLEMDIKRLRNEQEAAAKAGDWTKEDTVLSLECWRALTELDAKAREALELEKMRSKN